SRARREAKRQNPTHAEDREQTVRIQDLRAAFAEARRHRVLKLASSRAARQRKALVRRFAPNHAPRVRRWGFSVVLGAAGSALVGCGLLLGDLDLTLGPQGDASVLDGAAPGEGGTLPDGAPACVPESDCAGKCGQLRNSCAQIVTCGGCEAGTCGGGGPNTCGTGTCVPNCAGKACGESDECAGVCAQGTCASGLRCVSGVCACDSTSCTGCCASGA